MTVQAEDKEHRKRVITELCSEVNSFWAGVSSREPRINQIAFSESADVAALTLTFNEDFVTSSDTVSKSCKPVESFLDEPDALIGVSPVHKSITLTYLFKYYKGSRTLCESKGDKPKITVLSDGPRKRMHSAVDN